MSTDPHAPLRRDVKLLGALLGETLREQEGEALFQRVEQVRALSKGARAGDPLSGADLQALLAALPVSDAVPVARAFAHFLALANIAEQHHRVRRRNAYLLADGQAQRASLGASFHRILWSGISAEDVRATVLSLQIELVLTAHPTEVQRRTILQKHRRIADLLDRQDRVALTPQEQNDLNNELRGHIAAAWLTEEVRIARPTPVDEARGGTLVFEQTLWDAVPSFLRVLDADLRRHTGEGLPLDVAPIRFGSWMGGDRDGNPRG